jgi:hypothetical protein
LNLKPLTPYTISFTKSRIDGSTISNSALYPWYKIYFYKNDTLLSTESCSSSNVINGFASGSKNLSKQFVTPTECNRVQIFFDNNNGDANLNTLVSNIQLEQGEVATPYEPFIPKKIHTKNANDVYEEFYKEREIAIADISLETGAGKTNFPQGFTPENSIIIGHMDKNKWNMPFGNVKEVETIINGDERNLVAVGTGNFSGGAARTSIVLMKLY